MRIVYVLTSLGIGGAERQVLAVADRMAQRGHTVRLLVLRERLAEEWPTQIQMVRLGLRRNPFSLLAGLIHGRKFLRSFHPDIIHSHSFHANLFARILWAIASPAPLICTVHNVYEGGWHRMLAYRLTDFLAVRTTAVSTAAAERFVRLKAVTSEKCSVTPNGIDTTEFAPDPQRREATRAAMHAGGNFIWITAGRLAPAKDIPNLLGAFAIVLKTCADTTIWIAGEGNPPAALGDHAGIEDHAQPRNVRWLGLRRDMPALLDAADGFVLASAWEGMPLVAGEAMAMEKTVVATDVGGLRELVGETGVLVPAKNAEALAQAMLGVMQKSELDRRRLGEAARARIKAEFSIDARVDQWERLYAGCPRSRL